MANNEKNYSGLGNEIIAIVKGMATTFILFTDNISLFWKPIKRKAYKQIILSLVIVSKMKQVSILKTEHKHETEQSASQKAALIALQKQQQVLKLKEYLLLTGFALGGAFLRVPMQAIPSAEPITFFAILSGWLFGKNKGFLVGASALMLSNFMVFGGQGIWTPFQLVAFGIIGYLGGMLREKASILEVVGVAVIGTIVFEVIMNLASIIVFPFGFITILISGIPFLLIHLVSNTAFALILPKTKEWIYKKGGFNERELCNTLISRIHDTRRRKAVHG